MTTPDTQSSTQILSAVAAILQAVAWPLVAALFFLMYRARIGSLLDILGQKLATASKFKAWQLELDDTSQDIKDAVRKAGDTANPESTLGKISSAQVQAAEEVRDRIRNSPLPDTRALPAVREQLYALIQEYDQSRRDLPPGFVRTKKMTAIVAGMRALSLAALPLQAQLISESSPGARLAAICMLQISPDPDYFDWIIERLNAEDQAFILCQAAVAVLELVQSGKLDDKIKTHDAICGALHHISSFGDHPDQNTIEILQSAVAKVSG
jgi:hypothetical protein